MKKMTREDILERMKNADNKPDQAIGFILELIRLDPNNPGGRIKSKRIELKLSREDFSKKIGVSTKDLVLIERCKKALSIKDAQTIAKVLKVSVKWILSNQVD